MPASRRNAFTLVEILIVVVILGILAAIVIPQFSTAANSADKAAILKQLQSINVQLELYRTRNAGQLPSEHPTLPMGAEAGTNGGWGILVSEEYFREAPLNPYTRSILLVAGDEDDALAANNASGTGWFYEIVEDQIIVRPAGYNIATDQLYHEYQ